MNTAQATAVAKAVLLALAALPATVLGFELIDVRDPRVPDRITPNQSSAELAFSTDGRFVAYSSGADDIVTGDTNGRSDVFLFDRSTRRTQRVSLAPGGAEANSDSYQSSFSANGRLLAYTSNASNLVAADSNDHYDVFVRDLQTGATSRVSVGAGGTQANGRSASPSMSADGRYVAFESDASNLVPGDTNGLVDIFVRDRQNNTTTRASVAANGAQLTTGGSDPTISANGRYVTFGSGDGSAFVRDLQAGTTAQVDVDPQGNPGVGMPSYNLILAEPVISADGRYVAFASGRTNLVANDTNRDGDVFVRDMQLGITTRVSVDSQGAQSTTRPEDISDIDSFASTGPSISADGRFVTFRSRATNLVAQDTNGESDIFLHDRQTRATTRVSVDSSGAELTSPNTGNPFLGSSSAVISTDGRAVAFNSTAIFLIGDANEDTDAFIRDLTASTTTLVSNALMSVASTPSGGAFQQRRFPVSSDGRVVAFESRSKVLVPGDTSKRDVINVFARDRSSGTNQLVSSTSAGVGGNASSYFPAVSRSGRYVVFVTEASNLAPGADALHPAIMIRDLATRTTTLVSPNGDDPGVSDEGRFVVFQSEAPLIPADHNGVRDIYVRDRQTGTLQRVSVRPDGAELNDRSYSGAISGDGRYVAFTSEATNLPGGAPGVSNLYLHDRTTRSITLIARNSLGPSLDVSGRYVAFGSNEPLLPGDLNGDQGAADVFVYDRVTQKIARMSESSSGEAGNSFSTSPTMSAGGRYVSFQSFSSNLVNDGGSGTLYVHDRRTGLTIRTFSSAADPNFFPAITGDGSAVVFQSYSTELVPNDLNNVPDVFYKKRRPFPALLRINAGGTAYTDAAGREWSSDKGYNTGNTRRVGVAIANTPDPSLYQDERYDLSTSPALLYSLAIPNGRYLVRLHFAETNEANFGIGKRVFNVDIEGVRRFANLDVYAEAGARSALIKGAVTDVRDGRIDVLFGHKAQNPIINAIEVIPQ